jgi:cytochrome b pre-mRNA-processing protein 3
MADRKYISLFVTEVGMPDTMFSWFLITELHCWLLMTRAMAEGPEGRIVRNGITEALWQDVTTRMKKLEVSS